MKKKFLIQGFEEMDSNHTGYLEKHEIIEYLMKAHKIDKKRASQQANDLLKKMDSSGSGKISVNDYLFSQMANNEFIKQESVADFYNTIDINNKGYVSRNSLYNYVAENIGPDNGVNKQEINDFVDNIASQSDDGKITLDTIQNSILDQNEPETNV